MNETTTSKASIEVKAACLHCDQPLDVNAHGLRKFCEDVYYEGGEKKSCKDDHHSSLRLEEMKPYNAIAHRLRDIDRAIENFLRSKGVIITLEEINRLNIKLDTEARYEVKSCKHIFHFVRFTLIQTKDAHFKIESNAVL